MEPKEIADLFVVAVGKIEFFWNFYTVTLLAIIGWLVSTKAAIGIRIKFLITIGYLAFAAMNLRALMGSYIFAEMLRQDLLETMKAHPETLVKTAEYLDSRGFENWEYYSAVIHFVVGTLLLMVIWLGHFGNSSSDNIGNSESR